MLRVVGSRGQVNRKQDVLRVGPRRLPSFLQVEVAGGRFRDADKCSPTSGCAGPAAPWTELPQTVRSRKVLQGVVEDNASSREACKGARLGAGAPGRGRGRGKG